MTDARLQSLMVQAILKVPPILPATVLAVRASATSITLTWADPPVTINPVDHYEVRLDSGTPINKSLGLSHTFSGLTTGQTYSVSVRSVGAEGEASVWVVRGVNVYDDFEDNPFHGTPLFDGARVVQAAIKSIPTTYVGVGVPVEDLAPDSAIASRVRYPSEIIPIVQDGENRRVTLYDWLWPHGYGVAWHTAPPAFETHGGAGSTVNNGMTLWYLTPGIWRIKMVTTANRTGNVINGGMYFTHTGGAVTHFIFTKKFVSTATGTRTNREYPTSTDTARKVEGGAQRAINVRFSEPDGNDSSEGLCIYQGVVVVTSTIFFTVMGYSSTGGGNNMATLPGTSIEFRKMD